METPDLPAPPPPTSKQAIWSLVFGLLSIGCLWIFGAIPAMILGSRAKRNIEQSDGQLGGTGLAAGGFWTGFAGLFLGFVQLIWIAPIVALILSPVIAEFDVRFSGSNILTELAVDNVEELVVACRAYAENHEGNFPPSLATLWDEGYLEDERFRELVVSRGPGKPPFYRYRPGLTDSAPADTVLILSIATDAGADLDERLKQRPVVGFVDGTVSATTELEFEESVDLELFELPPEP